MPTLAPQIQPSIVPVISGRRALEVVLMFGDDVLDVRHIVAPKGIVIGEGKAADLFVSSDGLPASEFPLVRAEQGKYFLTFPGDQRGEINVGGTIHPLQWFKTHKAVSADPSLANCYRYSLTEESRVALRFEGISITLRYVSAPERLDEEPGKRELGYNVLLLGASSVVLLLVLAFAVLGPTPEQHEPARVKDATDRAATLSGFNQAPKMHFARAPLMLGLISADDAARALSKREAVVNECLSNGNASVHFTVDADGSAFVSTVRGANSTASACLYDALAGVRFDPPLDGGAELELFLGH